MKESRQPDGGVPVRGSLIGVVLISLAISTACNGGALTLDEWETQWDDVVERVATTVDEGVPTDTVCNQTLGYLREQRPELSPPPLEDLEAPVSAWFDEAEGLFFACDWMEEDGPVDELTTLDTLEAEVQLVLDLEG